MVALQNSQIDPTRQNRGGWSIEPLETAMRRSPELGRTFFARLWELYPLTREALVFLRWEGQPLDVYAVYDRIEDGFGVQIDPELGYIIVWDARVQGEYAAWTPETDPVEDALGHIAQVTRT